jgi:peroxiredoxin Q/BCP
MAASRAHPGTVGIQAGTGGTMLSTPLPTFSLLDDQGESITGKDLIGSWTVLYAYPKDSTPGCTTEACDFRDNWARVQALGAKVYGISKDSPKSHQNFRAKQELPFRLISDPEAALLKALGAFGKKVMYGKEMEGILRSTFLVDPQGVIRHVWPKVSVKGHVAEVLEILAKLKG